MKEYDPRIEEVLPHEKIYALQIGSEAFQVSGASLSSDSPSYFTDFFLKEGNKDKILIIDRSNEIFKLILQHLQGYHLEIMNADIYTRLFNDALYYNLPRLLKSLTLTNDYYYTIIESDYLKIPKKLMNDPSTGNFPNFFSVSNDALYKDISILMLNKNLIRPPPQAAPSLARPMSLLKDLISMLSNVEIEIRSKEHRCSLIKEAKYYRFNGLVQKLINLKIFYNPALNQEEVLIPIDFIDYKNITTDKKEDYLEIYYQRPYSIDSIRRLLNFQIPSNNEVLICNNKLIFSNLTLNKFTKLFKSLINKLNLKIEVTNEINLIKTENSITYKNEKVEINNKRKLDDSKDWILKNGILQFLINLKLNQIEAKLLKGEIFPNEPTEFYENIQFL